MRTRRSSYPSPSDGITFFIRPHHPAAKRRKLSSASPCSYFSQSQASPSVSSSSTSSSTTSSSSFDSLHDEIVISIMAAVSSSASSPSDLINAMLTCKRFCAAGTHPLVLASASSSALAVSASKWSDGAHRFLRQCAQSGNAEAAYTLGMIRFYCFNEREAGASLMAQAAITPHASALHSLAIIQFNGSGGTRKDKNLKNGASLCAKAAALAHVDAMRELGHCLQDGYGVPKNVPEGRRLLLEANAREAAAAVAASPRMFVETALQLAHTARGRCIHHHHNRAAVSKVEGGDAMAVDSAARTGGAGEASNEEARTPDSTRSASSEAESVRSGSEGANSAMDPAEVPRPNPNGAVSLQNHPVYRLLQGSGCSLLSDFGCNVPPAKIHIANKFLVDWFSARPPAGGLRLCSHANCGRPETRRHEFRRCSACGKVNYCSRACQALDWKLRHKLECTPVADWDDDAQNQQQNANPNPNLLQQQHNNLHLPPENHHHHHPGNYHHQQQQLRQNPQQQQLVQQIHQDANDDDQDEDNLHQS